MIRGSIMRAIRISKFGGPEVLQVEKIPIPEPKQNQVLIKVHGVGVNPVDTYIRSGGRPEKTPEDLPFTPGSDAAGVVTAIGPDAAGVKVGDRVFTCSFIGSGSYAEYMLIPSSRVFRLPDRLSFSQGAALGVPYLTALRALEHCGQAKAGQSVLIHGASGGVGLAACQLASMMKLDIVGTASTDEGARLVKAAGARLVLNHKDPEHATNLKNATGGKGFNIVLEMLANVNLPLDLGIVAEFGRIVVVGNRGKVEIDPRMIMTNESVVTGVRLGKTTEDQWATMAQHIIKGVEHQLITPVIDQEFSLDQAAEAHQAVMEHSGGTKGKIVLAIP